jgi:2-aminoadipate transaminase
VIEYYSILIFRHGAVLRLRAAGSAADLPLEVILMDYKFSDRISSLKPSAIREILKATSDPSVIPFAAGNPAPEAFPVDAIRTFTAEILGSEPIPALQYGISEGYTPLRDALRKRLRGRLHSCSDGDDLIIVSGAQQGIELASKVFCNEGDTVICEDPSFIGALNAIRSYNVVLRGVPVESDGIDTERLEQTLKTSKNTKLMYLIPNYQNPTGITMSAEKRRRVYELAKKYGVMIIEDDPYHDIRFAGEELPTIKSMDTEGLVIYCGSFSKTLSAGLRVGFVCAPAAVISKLTVAKQVSDVHTAMLCQMLAYKFLTEYDYDAHLERIQAIYRHKASLMLDGIRDNLDARITYTRPQGGLFLWCTLPASSDMLGYIKRAAQAGVAAVPGVAFNADPKSPCDSFRLNYSTPTDDQLVRGMEILGKIKF